MGGLIGIFCYDKIIRAGCYGAYATSELQAYDEFLARGGSLLLISEYRRTASDIDPLAERIGIQFRNTHYGNVSHYVPHPIANGATPFYFNAGAEVLNHSTNTNIQILGRLNNATGPAVMGILDHPQTKIFFNGDINGLQQIPQPFTGQSMSWLFD